MRQVGSTIWAGVTESPPVGFFVCADHEGGCVCQISGWDAGFGFHVALTRCYLRCSPGFDGMGEPPVYEGLLEGEEIEDVISERYCTIRTEFL